MFVWQDISIGGLPSVGRCHCEPNIYFPPQYYRDFDLWFALSGKSDIEIHGRRTVLEAGTVLLVPARVGVPQWTDARPFELAFVHFDLYWKGKMLTDARSYVDGESLTFQLPGLPAMALMARVPVDALAAELTAAAHRADDDVVQLEIQITIMRVLKALRREYLYGNHAPETSWHSIAETCARFMESHFSEPLTLNCLADRAGISKTHLGRLFQARFRTTPIRFLTARRMAHARHLLRRTDAHVGEVAMACGYQSIQFFSRMFKTEHGVSPRAYRQRERNQHADGSD